MNDLILIKNSFLTWWAENKNSPCQLISVVIKFGAAFMISLAFFHFTMIGGFLYLVFGPIYLVLDAFLPSDIVSFPALIIATVLFILLYGGLLYFVFKINFCSVRKEK